MSVHKKARYVPGFFICEQALIILTNLVKVLQQKQYIQIIVDLIPIANEAIQFLFVNLKVIEYTYKWNFY